MSLEQKSKILQTAKVLTLALILTLGAHLAMAQWTPPPNAPTTCDGTNPASPGCALPINVSTADQVKAGNLGLGIGAIDPAFKLEIAGNSLFTGILNLVNLNADALVVGDSTVDDSGDLIFYN